MCPSPRFRLIFASIFVCSSFAWGQTGAPAAATASVAPVVAPKAIAKEVPAGVAPAASTQSGSSSNQLIERIQVEGASTRIDEVRVGGETRSITVQPKGGLPAYDVQPATGARAWKVFGF